MINHQVAAQIMLMVMQLAVFIASNGMKIIQPIHSDNRLPIKNHGEYVHVSKAAKAYYWIVPGAWSKGLLQLKKKKKKKPACILLF